MDSEPYTINAKNEQKKNSDALLNDSSILEPSRIRRGSIDVDTINWFLIKSQFSFVLPCSIVLWVIFLLFW